jgi:hypothetical protein
MTVEELKALNSPDELESEHLTALWYDLHRDWDTAHGIVQRMYDTDAQWIHAYLHRKEPDIGNAKYWYSRSGHPYPGNIPFDEEVSTILSALPQGRDRAG